MKTHANNRVEFGDFQTPNSLARRVCEKLKSLGVSPSSIVEPTCGVGSFLREAIAYFPHSQNYLGFEINPQHVKRARVIDRAEVHQANFFNKNWGNLFDCLPEPILVIGNPPWVTNATLGMIGGTNLPRKTNFLNLNGLDAITGKSNFDISEWVLLHLMKCLSGRSAILAMLCKAAAARRTLFHAWNHRIKIAKADLYKVDAKENFGVSVDACLLVCQFDLSTSSKECAVYENIKNQHYSSVFLLQSGKLIANRDAFRKYGYLQGSCSQKWRSGIKHDCSRVMEFRSLGCGIFENKVKKIVELESNYLYPMLKSSDIGNGRLVPSRYMLVTQSYMGEDTSKIGHIAPNTWKYLQSYGHILDRRSSSIYKGKPRFSLFGIGKYAFSPWKVAISGFYKSLRFVGVSTFQGKPIVLDDTCYFLPCYTRNEMLNLLHALNSEPAQEFFDALAFWDEKRPITAKLLSRLNLDTLLEASPHDESTSPSARAGKAHLLI